MKPVALLLIYLTLLVLPERIIAQGEGNIWYFGYGAGLDFNNGSPIPLTNGVLSTNEGCAAISDPNGNLKFYTDGITVWNKQHNAMPNGTGLMGNPSSTQSGIIVPKPGSTSIYYVFTVDEEGGPDGLRYSEVDMNLDGGLGDVSVKNSLLATPTAEKITAVKKSNNIDFWVIAHGFNNDSFLVYSVTAAGVNSTPIISNAGTANDTLGIGYLKASTDGSKLAQAHYAAGMADVLNFNNSTGIVTIDFSFPSADVYGVEFSPNGERLYLTRYANKNVYQYDMTLANAAAIIASETIVGTTGNFTLAALQVGPDGKMYVAKRSSPNSGGVSLSCIPNPNVLGTACGFIDNGVPLAGKRSGSGLPTFIQTFFNLPVRFLHTCLGDTTAFTILDTTAVDSARWNFDDPESGTANTSYLLNPTHIFTQKGQYAVSAIIFKNGNPDTVSLAVNIRGFTVSLGNDTTVCQGTSVILNPGAGYAAYLWPGAATGNTYTAAHTGIYWVSVTDSTGCAAKDTINIEFEKCECNAMVPEAFSPNNDGHNDVLYVRGNCIKELSFSIYNRWGEKIFETNDMNTGWDGSQRGKTMNTGVYAYQLKAVLSDGNEISGKGTISLIR